MRGCLTHPAHSPWCDPGDVNQSLKALQMAGKQIGGELHLIIKVGCAGIGVGSGGARRGGIGAVLGGPWDLVGVRSNG